MIALSRVRIGTKQVAIAVLSVLLVAGMVANDRIAFTAIADKQNEAEASLSLVDEIMAVDAAAKRVQILNSNIRLAHELSAISRAAQALDEATKEGEAHLTAAHNAVRLEENKRRLAAALEAFQAYVGAAREIASAKNRMLGAITAQVGLTGSWEREIEALLRAPALAAAPHAARIERAIRQADAMVREARVQTWYFLFSSDEKIIEELLEDAAKEIQAARAASEEGPLAERAARLAAVVEQINTTTMAIVREGKAIDHTIRSKADPQSAKLETLIRETAESARQRSAGSVTEAATTMAWGAKVSLVIGVVVIMVMIASAALSVMTIARPVGRIAQVLRALAAGDKTVEIPYTGRDDEVGEAAKAAGAFKVNLIRMELLAAERQEAETRAAAEKREEMLALADTFEARSAAWSLRWRRRRASCRARRRPCRRLRRRPRISRRQWRARRKRRPPMFRRLLPQPSNWHPRCRKSAARSMNPPKWRDGRRVMPTTRAPRCGRCRRRPRRSATSSG